MTCPVSSCPVYSERFLALGGIENIFADQPHIDFTYTQIAKTNYLDPGPKVNALLLMSIYDVLAGFLGSGLLQLLINGIH